MTCKYTKLVFWHDHFLGAKNKYEFSPGEKKTDDEADYENAETSFQQNGDSDNSENVYMNVDVEEQKSNVDSVYEEIEVYENCAGVAVKPKQ